MNEDKATRLFSTAADSIPPIPRPPANQLIQQGKRVQRRRRLLSAGSVAAVAAFVIAAGALWLPGSSGSEQPPIATNQTTAPNDSVPPTTPDGSNRAELPTAPEGTRWLGYQGVMVAVPTDWRTQSGGCVDLPLHNTVFFEARQMLTCAGRRPPAVSSLRIYEGDSEQIEGLLPGLGQVSPLNGLNVRRKPTRMEGEKAEGVLLVETTNVLLWADSPDPAVVDAVLDSARLIPDGYTAVPDLSGLSSDSEVGPLVERAGLLWENRCPDGHTCDMNPQEATDPAAGSVVPVGTTVRGAFPESNRSVREPAGAPMPCNPGFGFPVRKDGCPDPDPETGWLTASGDGLMLSPFQSLVNDAVGEAYAREHGEEYPFPGDYFDAPDGPSHPLEFTRGTVCTGSILVGYQGGLADHVVTCDDLVKVAAHRRVPIAVWLSAGEVIQASELYRP